MESLVTVATDGFRDYVELPDGRSLNLGSVSVLKLISSLARDLRAARRALTTFLETDRAVFRANLIALENLLQPRRARWAHNGLITSFDQHGEIMSTANDVETKLRNLSASFQSLGGSPSREAAESFRGAVRDFALQVEAGLQGSPAEEPKVATESPPEEPVVAASSPPVEEPKVAAEGDSTESIVKLAAEEVPLVNEGLVHLVVAKVGAALTAVDASAKKGTDAAKSDLQRISKEIDKIANTSDFKDPGLRAALVDLSQKADLVRDFFHVEAQ